MSKIAVEVIFILALVMANGIFSMAELALLSSRKMRLQQRAEDGDAKAKRALALAEEPKRFLSTVQVGITLVGILSGAVGGATLAETLGALLARWEWIAPYSEGLAVFIVVLIITYLSLVLGELVPKQLALANPEDLASKLAGPMSFLSRATAPLVKLLSASTDGILRLMGFKGSTEPPVTAEEIKGLMEQGELVGVFDEAETDMVEGVFRLSDRLVGAVMTPRTEIDWLDTEDPLEQNLQVVIRSQHDLFPVAEGNLDNVLGVVTSKDFLNYFGRAEEMNLASLARPAVFVPESTSVLKLVDLLQNTSDRLLLVIDEFGGLLGMVTLFDVLKSIVTGSGAGQFTSMMAVKREDGSWLVDGLMPVDQFKDLFDLDDLPEEDRIGYQTVAGFVLSQLGAIPGPGKHFEWGGLRMEVLDMDGLRVDKVLVMPLESQEDEAS
ncbi:MAG: HlyC/CorC family transporter [Anaerolineaceae bacterium]|nr:HlyC/CorC family transporter [Anaerolineaceae bacterium]